jgi:hypothetical protein
VEGEVDAHDNDLEDVAGVPLLFVTDLEIISNILRV